MEEYFIPKHRVVAYILELSYLPKKTRKVHSQSWNIIVPYAFKTQAQQSLSTIPVLLHPVVFPPGKTYDNA